MQDQMNQRRTRPALGRQDGNVPALGFIPGVPFIVNRPVHLGLELVGASANRPAVTASPLRARVLLKVLFRREEEKQEEERSQMAWSE